MASVARNGAQLTKTCQISFMFGLLWGELPESRAGIVGIAPHMGQPNGWKITAKHSFGPTSSAEAWYLRRSCSTKKNMAFYTLTFQLVNLFTVKPQNICHIIWGFLNVCVFFVGQSYDLALDLNENSLLMASFKS